MTGVPRSRRLELLRKLVPHAERANTACFLEEVIKYIEVLKRRVVELETTLQAVKSGVKVRDDMQSTSLG